MAYVIPKYISDAGIDDREIRFEWDDTKASGSFTYDPAQLLDTLSQVHLRAKIAAAIGIYEWVVWRFHTVVGDPTPMQIAEAAWCANVHRSHMKYFEFNRKKWLGPVRGPLWIGMTWLISMLFFSDDDEAEWEADLTFLSSLAMHVLPNTKSFEKWLTHSSELLLASYGAPKEDSFEDLFGDREEERRGPYVPREILDPTIEFEPEKTQQLVNEFLRGVDYNANPYLNTPEEMIEAGFEGTPYSV